MKILVLHNNYPAQFKFLLPDLIKYNHEVVFLSIESHGNKISGVKHYKIHAANNEDPLAWKAPYKGLGKKVSVSELFRGAFDSLKKDGFYPDITIFHSGWGIGFFLKSVFPLTKAVAYAEWWFQWDSVEAAFDPSSTYSPTGSLKDKVSHQLLNASQATEICEADLVWTPTNWQKTQFPLSLQSRMSVIHEGVDTRSFSPNKERIFDKNNLHITYSSRALEAMRCFDHFTQIIALVLKSDPRVKLTIIGKEKAVYRPLSKNMQSLTSIAKDTFSKIGVMDRVKFYSRLGFDDYRSVFRSSDVHFYYSRPFVASWSLLEAMSSGCTIVSNPSPMTNEFLESNSNSIGAFMTDCMDHKKSASQVLDLLNSPGSMKEISLDLRKRALKLDYELQLAKLKNFIGY